ncbi:MAG: carbohydrate kinase family protein [Lachnospiraceae bacterium]|nr:carbohydrate kinase family protein [Lachnospiraceae bacterium]
MNEYTIFLGDVALDEYYAVKKWPGRADKVGTEMLESQMGGMIANAASVYASYGSDTRFSGILCPSDIKLSNSLEEIGIDTSLVIYDSSLVNSKCMIFLSEGEHTVFIINTKLKTMPITESMQDKYCRASTIYTGFWAMQYLRLGNMGPIDIIKQWHQHNVQIMVDSDVDKISEEDKLLLPYVHTLFMNEVGFDNQKEGRSDEETVQYLLHSGPKILIVTVAEKGCYVYTRNVRFQIDGVPNTVVDVTGAGDTFCSSFTFLYNRSKDIQLSAKFAVFASSRAVGHMGARGGAVGSDPVLAYMEKHGEDTSEYRKYL